MEEFIRICGEVTLTNPLEMRVEAGGPNYVLHHDDQ
jgi:hypothetical protein